MPYETRERGIKTEKHLFVFKCEGTNWEPYSYDKRLGYLFTPRQAIQYCEFYGLEFELHFVCGGSLESIDQLRNMREKYKEYLKE